MASPRDPDLPPAFPLPGSAQRMRAGSGGGSGSGRDVPPPGKSAPLGFTVSGPLHSRAHEAKSQVVELNASASAGTSAPSSSKAQALRSVLDTPSKSTGSERTSAGTGSTAASTLMPPPGKHASAAKPASASGSTPSSSLMPPPSTSRLTAPPGVGGASGASLRAPSSSSSSSSSGSSLAPAPEKFIPGEVTPSRRKVALAPGRSPLDWARLKNSNDALALREGRLGFARIPMSEVRRHRGADSAWSVFNGKVYNITPYIEFHPGGREELMRCAGRDGTRLFMLTHSWVNIDAMIDSCCIGMAVKDE